MTEAMFAPFVEYNDHEGETWVWFLRVEGNEEFLELLDEQLKAVDEDEWFRFKDSVPVSVVEALEEHGNPFCSGYFDKFNLVDGVLDLERLKSVDFSFGDEDGWGLPGWVESFYKGGIRDFVVS